MIVGLGCAAQLAKEDLRGAEENAQIRRVRDYFEAKLVKVALLHLCSRIKCIVVDSNSSCQFRL